MITSAQATQYLADVLGMSVPSFIVDAAVTKVAAVESALISAGYTAADQVIIECMAVCIIAAAGSPRRIQSQGASSGASRSFTNDAKALSALRRSLSELDTVGITALLVGADPSASSMFLAV
jgi:hypothetical protein